MAQSFYSLFSKKERLLITALACIQFFHIIDFMIMMPLGPQLMRQFAIGPAEFGWLVSAYTLAAGITGFVSSFFVDRFDRKKTLLFFYIGFGISTIACATAENYEFLFSARTLAGAFGGVLGSCILAIVGDSITIERRGSAIGLLMLSFSAASIIGVPVSLLIANLYNWHAPFFVLGLLSLLFLAFVIYAVPVMRGHLTTEPHDSAWTIFLRVCNNSNQLTALALMATVVLGQFMVIPFVSASLVANVGLLESQLPLIYLAGGAVSIFASPLIGRMVDRSGAQRTFQIFATISILPILLITHLAETPLPLILLIVALMFSSIGGRMIPTSSIATSTVIPRYRGSFMGFVSTAQQLASAAGAFIAGHVVTKDASGHLKNYTLIGYASVAFTLLALYLVRKIRPAERLQSGPFEG